MPKLTIFGKKLSEINIFWILVAITLTLKLIILQLPAFQNGMALKVADLKYFQNVAENILQGHGAICDLLDQRPYSAYKIPALLMSFCMLLAKGNWGQLFVYFSTFVTAFSPPLFFLLLNRLYKNYKLSIIGSLMYLFNPVILYDSIILGAEGLYLLFLMAGLYFIFYGLSIKSPANILIAGIFWQLGLQSRPFLLFITPILLIYLLWQKNILRILFPFILGILIAAAALHPLLKTSKEYKSYDVSDLNTKVCLLFSTNLQHAPDYFRAKAPYLYHFRGSYAAFLKAYAGTWRNPADYFQSCWKSFKSTYKLSANINEKNSFKGYEKTTMFYFSMEYLFLIIGLYGQFKNKIKHGLFFASIILAGTLLYTFIILGGQLRFKMQWETFILIFSAYGLNYTFFKKT